MVGFAGDCTLVNPQSTITLFCMICPFVDLPGTLTLTANWPAKQELVKGGVLTLNATVQHGTLQWYWNAEPIDNGGVPSGLTISRKITRVGNDIVKEEQTLRLENMTRKNSGIYQVLATGFAEKFMPFSQHTEVKSYSTSYKPYATL